MSPLAKFVSSFFGVEPNPSGESPTETPTIAARGSGGSPEGHRPASPVVGASSRVSPGGNGGLPIDIALAVLREGCSPAAMVDPDYHDRRASVLDQLADAIARELAAIARRRAAELRFAQLKEAISG